MTRKSPFKIIVLGSKGMLGQMVFNYFSKHYEVIRYDARYTSDSRKKYLDKLNELGQAIVINCIGLIKQKSNVASDLYFCNSILPYDLAAKLLPNSILIQPSTDCVYEGDREGFYVHDWLPDSRDDYGRSKSLGERAVFGRANCYLLRTSIVGPDSSDRAAGLLSWFLRQKRGAEINGFTDHYWNGITTLEWCKMVHSIVFNDSERRLSGQVLQLGVSTKYSKYDVLTIFGREFRPDILVKPIVTGKKVNRCLAPEYLCSSFERQVRDLKELGYVEAC